MVKAINKTEETLDIRRILGENIKKNRLALGYTREKLAEKLDVSSRVIYDYEDGFKLPRTEKLPVLAHIFNVSLDSLFSK